MVVWLLRWGDNHSLVVLPVLESFLAESCNKYIVISGSLRYVCKPFKVVLMKDGDALSVLT